MRRHRRKFPRESRIRRNSKPHGTPNEVQKFALYDARNPWGPWTTIAYYDNWGSYGTSPGLWYSIVPKWISADGKTFWMSFSGGSDGTVNMDAFHLIKGEFTLGIGGSAPSPPTGIKLQ